jgi:hypothetical protein
VLNPLRSEREAFQVLLYVLVAAAAIILVALLIRAIL